MEKGEIFRAKDKKNHPHLIVFLEYLKDDNSKFNACILSSKAVRGNILMSEEHFIEKDENGKQYPIQFKTSHLIQGRFIKEELWLASQIPQGKLTEKGIDFIEEQTKGIEPKCHPVAIYNTK